MARYENWVPPPPVEAISPEEELFSDLLDRSIRAPETMRSFFDTDRPPIGEEEQPFRTVRQLEITARCDFLSGILLLGSNVLSWGAERHVLGVLESFAHIAWILGQVEETEAQGTAPLDDAAGRAACVALGRALAQRDAWRRGRAGSQTLERVEQMVQRARAEHEATGCTCGGRGTGTVQATLEALTEGMEGSVASLPDVWTVLRAGAAGDGAERLIPHLDGDDLAYAPYTHRALMLASLLNGYGIPATWLLSIDQQSHSDMLGHVTEKLLDSEEMQAALNGDLDAGRLPAKPESAEASDDDE
jgi:hypothetical protein